MKFSSYFIFTTKEKPAGATTKGHSLLLRASYISQLAAGIYNFLPLGFRVLKKVWKIVEEEMDRIGSLQILMPAIHPSDLWEKTGRWITMDNVMFKFEDKKGTKMVLGTTHEEIVTDIVSKYVKSYKNLPLLLYQIQVKFRDEIRPKGGLIRAREFIMKDLYSFHTSWEDLDKTYNDVYKAYNRIFERLSIPVEVVEAFSGPIGGDVSHEFMVVTPAGEDKFVKCSNCGYAVSTEIAQVKPPIISYSYKPPENINKIYTPNVKTVEELVSFLSKTERDFIKSVLYKNGNEYVLVLVRGDKEVNEIKLSRFLKNEPVLAKEEDFEKIGSILGFIGPIGLKKKVRIIADYSVLNLKDCIIGANEKDYHYSGVDYENIPIDEFADISTVIEGDLCFKCGGEYKIFPALELGHIFKLGTKYSEPLNAYFIDKDGQRKPIIMGCYGIGVSRIISAIIEVYGQENSMCWTFNSTPFFVYLITINVEDKDQFEASSKLYKSLVRNGIEVLWDDRKESPGTKFKDWQLIGIPLCLVVGNKVNENIVELKINSNFAELKFIDINLNKTDNKEISMNLNLDKVMEVIRGIYDKIDSKLNKGIYVVEE